MSLYRARFIKTKPCNYYKNKLRFSSLGHSDIDDLGRFLLSCLDPLILLHPKDCKFIWFLSVPVGGYFRYALCTLNLISTF